VLAYHLPTSSIIYLQGACGHDRSLGALDQPDGADHLAGVLAGLMGEGSVKPDGLSSQLTPTSRGALRSTAAGETTSTRARGPEHTMEAP
jgi:hypothetical protein